MKERKCTHCLEGVVFKVTSLNNCYVTYCPVCKGLGAIAEEQLEAIIKIEERRGYAV